MPARTVTRKPYLIWAAASFLVLLGLSVMVQVEWPRLEAFDRGFGDGLRGWALQHATVIQILHVIEDAFGTLALTIYTTVLAAALFARRHRRAAYWTVGVMLAASLTTYFLKRFFERARPELEDPIHTLDSFAFPSGHSSGIASGMGVAIVLTLMLVRRRGVRRGLVWLWVSLIVLVAADRILLGVHALSDVVAGLSVGFFWVAVGMMVYHPAPRTRVLEQFTSPVPSTRQLAVVLNPIKVEDITAFKVMVERMAEDSGWGRPEWYQTTIEDPGKSMAEAAAIAGAELVLVCGGDGTVRTVCAELAGTGIPVGVVPAGTGNLLARNLGIPLYLQAAIDVALNGQDRAIDLVAISGDGLDDDEHFMVMAGMGFDAAIMEGANEQIKARVGWLAYVVAGLRNLMFPAVRLEISVDDGPFTKHRARTVVVGNVGYLQAGIPLLPDAAIDDGVLDVVLVAPARFVSWVPLAFRVLSKNKRTDAALDRMTGRKVSIRAAHDTPRQLDGDSIGMGKELHAECIHGRLLVRVPR